MNTIISPSNRYYFTFAPNSPFHSGYMVVTASTEKEARSIMLEEYGTVIWILSFTELDFAHITINSPYKMYEIPFGYMPEDIPWLKDYSESCNPPLILTNK